MNINQSFVDDIRGLITSARAVVARGVDLVQVRTNYAIGRRIVQQEQRGKDRAAYGKEILIALAERLSKEFGNGYSRSNLEYMRRFFLQYRDRLPISQTTSGKLLDAEKSQTMSGQLINREDAIFEIVQTASGQLADRENAADVTTFQIVQKTSGQSARPFSLSWSHYVFLLGIKNADERSFYEIEAASQDWTLRELKRQFDSGLYERLVLSPSIPFALSLSKGCY